MRPRKPWVDGVIRRTDDRTLSLRRGTVTFDVSWLVRDAGRFWTMRRRQRPYPTYTLLLFPWKDEKREFRMMRTKLISGDISPMTRDIDHGLVGRTANDNNVDDAGFLVRDSHITRRGDVMVADSDLRRMGVEEFMILEEMVREIPSFPVLR